MNRISYFWIFFSVLLTPLCTGGAQVVMYEDLQVDKITIESMNVKTDNLCPVEQIKARLMTREGDYFSHVNFDNDLKSLVQEFDRVEPSLKEVDGKLVIALKVWVRPAIRTIFWDGNKRILTKRLQRELGISNCAVFDRLKFNKAFHKLKAYYIRKGFFEAELDYHVVYDEDENVVDITIDIVEGRSGHIKEIKFLNFTSHEQEALLEKMVTKEYCLFTSWLTHEGTYHEEAVLQDQFTIINFLQNEGYADARVDIAIEEMPNCDKINVLVVANKGARYAFQEISFEGNTLLSDECISKLIHIREGRPFSPDRIRETVQRITQAYGKRGYIDAIVQFEPKLNCENQTYDIHFTIEEGCQFRVGMIKVLGNCSTETRVILHETLLVPGEVFNLEKLQRTEERLRNIGYFKNVNVYAVKSEGELGLGENYRDVHIEVEETNTGHFSAFAGFSTTESVFGGLSLTESNFKSKGLTSLFCNGLSGLRGGGEYLQLSATLGAKSRSYLLSWSEPHFKDTPFTVGFDLESSSNRYISNDYDIESTGFNLHAMYQINTFLKGGAHYRRTNAQVHMDKEAKRHVKTEEIIEHGEEKISGIVSAIGVSLIYDSSDHPHKPHAGFKSRFDVEFAGLLGHHHFFSFAYLNSYYFPVGPKGVFRVRGDFRFIKPFSSSTVRSIPLDERLFLGGDNGIRGWRPYKLGPTFEKINDKGEAVPSDDPRGGISMQIYSLEYSRELHKKVEGFVFFDAGYLSDKEWRLANVKELWSSLGGGLRIKVLDSVPPVTVGVGFPIYPEDRSLVKRFFLTVGGKF